MGNQAAQGGNKMAIAAMSYVTHLSQSQLEILLGMFYEAAESSFNPNYINRADFSAVLIGIEINPNDADILDRLFTMYDDRNQDHVSIKDFIVGISPLVTVNSDTVQERLRLAFHLYDDDRDGSLLVSDMINVLKQINRVASYFGDSVLKEEQIVLIIRDSVHPHEVTSTVAINFGDYVEPIASHPLVSLFLSGAGTVHYGAHTYL
jgi:Ca2+-binding EF-hand superfamily protein